MKSLFVGNLSFDTTEGQIREAVAPFGQISRVHLAKDRETGRARGFAFVEMPDDAEAAKAIAGLDGKELGGRNLKVNEARPKGERPAFGNSGRPGGGGRFSGERSGGGRSGGGDRSSRFSTEDFREAARQPREPRW